MARFPRNRAFAMSHQCIHGECAHGICLLAPCSGCEADAEQVAAAVQTPLGLQIDCCHCRKRLTEPGALLFSPPDEEGTTKKLHLCSPCYRLVREFMGLAD